MTENKSCSCCAPHEESNHSREENEKTSILTYVRFGAGIVVFIAGILLPEPIIKNILLLSAYAILGYDVLIDAAKNVFKAKMLDENFLMAIATVGAVAIGEFAEAVGVMLFYQIGEMCQDYAVGKSRRSIKGILALRPDYANVVEDDGSVRKYSPEKVQTGMIVQVKKGERVPLDGILLSDSMTADTSALTGESRPRDITAGEEVLSGMINSDAAVKIKVTSSYENSTVARLLEMVEKASENKAQSENFITKFAKIYTPVVVISAIALMLGGFIITGNFSTWLYRSLVFLVISCPCALVISIPLTYFAGIGLASKNGILFKGGNYLEALVNVETAVFDKTGTLTKGAFEVSEVVTLSDISRGKLIEITAHGESLSTHPIAQSIVNYYGKTPDNSKITEHREIAGNGISFLFEGEKYSAGSEKFLSGEGINMPDKIIPGAIYIACEKTLAGYIVMSDVIKEGSCNLAKKIKQLGIKRTVMLTGDSGQAAVETAKVLDIDEVHAELLPDGKLKLLEEMCKSQKVMFAGDGINDAPVLKRADVGIAMGGLGSDAAIEAADVVIMNDSPEKIISGIKIAKRTKTVVLQNIVFILLLKGIILILGALGYANMWLAIFADVGVSLLATLNAMKVLLYKPN